MIIEKIKITKFRGFEDVEFELGTQLTIIAGQNGTQKTTVLGMLSQPFTTSKDNPMRPERPLSGGNFISGFKDKFKLSDKFDTHGSHEWSLYLHNVDEPFTVVSIERIKGSVDVRFWQKGTREKGSGYIQLPVIFLSLKRLLPIGEDNKLKEGEIQELTSDEHDFLVKWHKRILLSRDDITDTNYLYSPDKTTLGINTANYDWKSNSAGQDNIGKILLAILSFQRLKQKYPKDYKGGILSIDELDATLYPGSQLKLIEFLRNFSSELHLQVLFTTHSLTILEKVCELQTLGYKYKSTEKQIRVLYLEKKDGKVKVVPNISFDSIRHKLNVSVGKTAKVNNKILAYAEDKEATIFAKTLLKTKGYNLKFVDCSLGHGNLIQLGLKKVPAFTFPNSLIFLDGDVKDKSKITKNLKNFIFLPTCLSPEIVLANYLNALPEESPIWESIYPDFSHQYCFEKYPYESLSERVMAKKWFNYHLDIWGKNANRVINPWMKDNKEKVDTFIYEFTEAYNKIAKGRGLEILK